MTISELGSLGEFISSIVVVITVIYLAVQMRQNTKAQTIATFESAMAGFNEVNYFAFSDKQRTSTLLTGLRNPETLDEVDHAIYVGIVRCYSNHVYKLFRLYERGVFPKYEWLNAAKEYKQFMATSGGQQFREANHYFDDLWVALDALEEAQFSDFGFDLKNQ